MSLLADLRILFHLAFAPARGDDPAARLEAFYRHQAEGYDDFRRRLLHGREEMMRGLDLPEGARLLDLGGGTGSNLEYLADRWDRLGGVTVVDLCPALLAVARQRAARPGWEKVAVVQADATTYEPPSGPVDAVTFSYALTMIPDWFRAVDRALALLRPGGMIGVADFYVARKWPAAGLRRHPAWQRWFWPWWFSWDNVFLSPDALPYLQSRFQTVRLEERQGRVPYLPGLRVPYYIFLGRRP
jgi:S-adenosylmethionine-diacylgycerolhomoserine-N-methlytransferase